MIFLLLTLMLPNGFERYGKAAENNMLYSGWKDTKPGFVFMNYPYLKSRSLCISSLLLLITPKSKK